MTESARPEPGWYPDPAGSPQLRWWDGDTWTDDTTSPSTPAAETSAAPGTGRDEGTRIGTATTEAPVAARTAADSTTAAVLDRAGRPRHPARAAALIVGLVVVALVAATALVSSLNRPRLNTANLERQIAQEVADAAGAGAVVRCPDRVDLMEGATFTCEIELDGGQTATAIVTQTDDRGSVSWKLDTGTGTTTP